jgi:hypothetical protein
VEDGLAVAARNNDRHYDADLYRIKGELLWQTSKRKSPANLKESEAYFLLAIETAHKQKARSLELRAAIGLAGFVENIRQGATSF